MKKIFLIIGFFLLQTSNAQDIGITQVTVSSISAEEINVNLKVITNASEFISSSYSINGNEINLNVCYFTLSIGLVFPLENDIPITIIENGNYNLNIVVYQSSLNTICDYNNIQDTASLSFTTPLSEPVTLSTTDVSSTPSNILYPNPTTGIINTNNFTSKSITVYDNLGRIVKQFHNFKNNIIDISEFDDGLYYIETETLDDRKIKKIILKK